MIITCKATVTALQATLTSSQVLKDCSESSYSVSTTEAETKLPQKKKSIPADMIEEDDEPQHDGQSNSPTTVHQSDSQPIAIISETLTATKDSPIGLSEEEGNQYAADTTNDGLETLTGLSEEEDLMACSSTVHQSDSQSIAKDSPFTVHQSGSQSTASVTDTLTVTNDGLGDLSEEDNPSASVMNSPIATLVHRSDSDNSQGLESHTPNITSTQTAAGITNDSLETQPLEANAVSIYVYNIHTCMYVCSRLLGNPTLRGPYFIV